MGPGGRRRGPARQEPPVLDRQGAAPDRRPGPGGADRHPGGEQPHRALGDPRLGDPRAARLPQRLPQGVGRADRVRPRAQQGAAVRRADRPVPAAPPQVRPRRRPGAAGQDRDRPHPRADPRAGGALRDRGPRLDGPDRARRRAHPPRAGAGAAHRAQADLQPPGALPQADQPAARRPLREARAGRRAGRHRARRGWCGAGLHPVRRDGPAAGGAPRAHRRTHPVPARRHPGPRARGDGAPVPGRHG